MANQLSDVVEMCTMETQKSAHCICCFRLLFNETSLTGADHTPQSLFVLREDASAAELGLLMCLEVYVVTVG